MEKTTEQIMEQTKEFYAEQRKIRARMKERLESLSGRELKNLILNLIGNDKEERINHLMYHYTAAQLDRNL